MRLLARGKRYISLLLCFMIIFSSLTVSVCAEAQDSVDLVLHTLYPSEIIAQLYDGISDAEATFLDGELSEDIAVYFTVEYDAFSLTDAVGAEIERVGSDTHVSITAENYVADTLTWIPVRAAVDFGGVSKTVALDGDGGAQVIFEGAQEEKYVTVSVEYEAKISYPERLMSAVANAAYNAGQAAINAIEKYESDVLLYDQKLNAYKDYQQELKVYESEMRKYNAYLSEMKQYESELEEYNTYLAKLEEYGKRLEEYEAYLTEYQIYAAAYENYLDFLKNPQKYEDMYKKYVEYLEMRALMEAQLVYPDSAFVKDSVGHILYETLRGDTVATVVKNQDALVSTGCDAGDIANADRSTKELTAWLEAYPRRGNVDERYEYYIKNYAKLSESVTTLYTSLARLYTNDAVPSILEAKDRLERYWQFVSQLYVLHCALDDGAVYNPNWTIAGAYPSDLLEDCYMLPDGNSATPMEKIPDVVKESEDPSKIQKPTPPAEVQKPTVPVEVENPQKPQEVVKPVYPTAVEHPGKVPVEPTFSSAVTTLIKDIESGALARRDVLGEQEVSVKLTAQKAVAFDGYAALGFYERGTASLSEVKVVAVGESIALPQPKSNEFSDRERVYTFASWQLVDGQTCTDTLTATEDACITAAYRSDTRKYAVVWDTGEGVVTTYHAYGTTPAYSGILSIPDSAEYSYDFTHWTPSPSPVVSDAEYTAQYTQVRRSYTVSWSVGDDVITEEYEYGQMPEFDRNDIILAHLDSLRAGSGGIYSYKFDGWDKEISPVTGNITYTAVFFAAELIPNIDSGITVSISMSNSAITIHVSSRGADKTDTTLDISEIFKILQNRALNIQLDGYTVHFPKKEAEKLAASGKLLKIYADSVQIYVDVLDNSGVSVASDAVAQVTLNGTLTERGDLRVYTDGQACEFTVSEGKISFALTVGKKYDVLRGAHILVNDADGGDCIVEGDHFATVGEQVSVSVLARIGYTVGKFTVKLSDGSELAFKLEDGKYVFTMPDEDVYIQAEFERILYTVKFMADGKLISEEQYYYGDTVICPPNPQKKADGENTYAFVGWDKPVRSVDSDAVYNAVFLASPIAEVDSVPEAELGLVEMVLIVFASAVVCASGLLTVFFLVRKRKMSRAAEKQ